MGGKIQRGSGSCGDNGRTEDVFGWQGNQGDCRRNLRSQARRTVGVSKTSRQQIVSQPQGRRGNHCRICRGETGGFSRRIRQPIALGGRTINRPQFWRQLVLLPGPGAAFLEENFVSSSDSKLALFTQEISDIVVFEYVSEHTSRRAVGIVMVRRFPG